MCDRAHPMALPAASGEGSHPSWALPSRVHEGLGYRAFHPRTAYKVMPWPGHVQPFKTPASSTCAVQDSTSAIRIRKRGPLTPGPPYKGEGLASTILVKPSPGRRRCAAAATLSRFEAR